MMRVRTPQSRPGKSPRLPKRSDFEDSRDLQLARAELIASDPTIAEGDRFILQIVATLEANKVTFNKLYRLLRQKQREQPSDATGKVRAIFGWPDT
jgi:hypothetical protein